MRVTTRLFASISLSLLLPFLLAAAPPDESRQTTLHVSELNCKKLFQVQVERLVSLRYPSALGMSDIEFRRRLSVLEGDLANGVQISEHENIPFLIVIPDRVLEVGTQFDLLELSEGKRGSSVYREPTEWIVDTVQTPDSPYLVFDVNTGLEPKTVSFDSLGQANQFLAAKERRGLTAAEAIVLVAQFPDVVMNNTTVYAAASIWSLGEEKATPRIGSTFGYPLLTYLLPNHFGRVPLPASCQDSEDR